MIEEQQITQEECDEFHALGKRMLAIYHKLPQNESKKKILIAGDAKANGMIFIQANQEELLQIYEYLKAL